MRKFILKYTFGRYWYRFPWQHHYNCTSRGPFWYYNGYLIIALVFIFSGGTADWVIQWPAYLWSAVVLYFGFPLLGFSYYERFPAKWHELDEEQKWYFGNAVTSGDLRKHPPLPTSQFQEYVRIATKMRKKYNLR